ncbi:helix-turn-helix domain-containing protein [Nocardiopsis dassonvillei]|uniref:Transcriptional regulator, CdaR n=1 Tax=Nocardiopsis dassonvillei (strain ATCC 23218 / DSM 43111 / CIP 107115 / JCM 7437 / KCTC 9190 / NBRC 14626 / NCTC 10488 / NRRL B-5397 / IMRU 509) TaxID=446468 RepID=D7B6X4_NOCDD|nr:helix-turn-helix domain-containing protein [Nocardiopsis dassonvillei]ADH65528.1 transcriptional regulator, CdaR [Nocardiopsis dassonvillei subsp. dassonvillei DSM 43111]VEI91546.1 Sugar diacid utilization regulator [Nocardiopsis dassonvillei]
MSNDRPASDPRPASGGGSPRPHPRPEVPPVQDGSSDDRTTGLPLRGLLLALGDPVVDVAAAPDGLDVQVDNVVILDPEDRTEVREGDLVLLIGARGASARRLVRALAERGATAVAVKTSAHPASEEAPPTAGTRPGRPRPGGGDEARALRTEAREAGIALLAVRPEVRWDQLQSVCRSILDEARLTASEDLGESGGDLFSMAQTIARLTGGLVSIEDAASRVLAYSSGAEVDELRRLSVLGRRGPESYLALLREWGVFAKLRAGEEVVRVEEHPELGIRRRLAVGIHAGRQPLGAIWVQEGDRPLAEHAEEALLGAARTTALQMIRQRTQASAGLRLREDLLSSLLEGRIDAGALADTVEVHADRGALVVAFALVEGSEGAAEERPDRPERELRRRQLIDLVSVHTAAYRRSALVTALGGRVYVLLPDLARVREGRRGVERSVLALTRKTVAAARAALGLEVRAAVGSLVERLGDVPDSRAEADRVLDAVERSPDRGPGWDVATISDVRSRVLVSETLARLREDPSLRDPRVSRLIEHDRAGGADLVRSLLAYLEAFGDARAAAERLHIHPNTLRYRVRRAASVSGIDLGDPGERLFTQLQLLMEQQGPTR